jgi:hypothetical protein
MASNVQSVSSVAPVEQRKLPRTISVFSAAAAKGRFPDLEDLVAPTPKKPKLPIKRAASTLNDLKYSGLEGHEDKPAAKKPKSNDLVYVPFTVDPKEPDPAHLIRELQQEVAKLKLRVAFLETCQTEEGYSDDDSEDDDFICEDSD